MEAQLMRDESEEKSGRKFAYDVVSLVPVERGDDLTIQCTKCFENLDRCIRAAEIASQVDYTFTRTILDPIRDVMHERRLRLSVWMSDCRVHGGDLSKLDPGDESDPDLLLTESLESTFARIDDAADSLFKAIQAIKFLAEQAYKVTDDGAFLHAISKEGDLLESGCDNLNTCLYDLARLQNSLQLALGVRGVGPEAALYKDIASVKASFPPDDETNSTTSDRASKRTTQEECDSCGLLFPAHALASHQDSCLAPELELSSPLNESLRPAPHTDIVSRHHSFWTGRPHHSQRSSVHDFLTIQCDVLRNTESATDDLPATYHYYDATGEHVVGNPTEYMPSFLENELSLDRFAKMGGYLRFAGEKGPAMPLHSYIALGREIVIADQMDMHLLRASKGKLFVKPVPRFLLNPRFCRDNLGTGSVGQSVALGFLYTYVCLISSETDFHVANEMRLLPRKELDATIEWADWKTLARDLLRVVKGGRGFIDQRFEYAELRLSRLNIIHYFTRVISLHERLRS